MYRNDAILMIEQISGKSISESRKYLDRIITLYAPEFDNLKTNLLPLSGTKTSHLKGIVRTYITDGQTLQ